MEMVTNYQLIRGLVRLFGLDPMLAFSELKEVCMYVCVCVHCMRVSVCMYVCVCACVIAYDVRMCVYVHV